jgi:UDP-N-acetylmuramoyl-L-alanyl-D-glutamate--2,6-diaminopimelate ligase
MNAAPVPQSLPQLLRGYGGPVPDVHVSGVQMDSRRVVAGDLFLACKGHGQHGLSYLDQALNNGASAVVWEPTAEWSRPAIKIPNVAVDRLTHRAGEIAARFFGEPTRQIMTTGITGTDGKTSTAWLLTQAFEQLGRPCAYLGTLGYGRIGQLQAATHTTPDPVSLQQNFARLRDEGVTAAAMEVSSHALDQDRVAGVHFCSVILTNITRDHLDYHGTVENYAAAKRKLFEGKGVQTLIFNRDDSYGSRWAADFPKATVYGLEGVKPKATHYVLGRNLQLLSTGIRFEIDSSWGGGVLESRLLGRFNAYNLLAALAAILHSDVSLERALTALGDVSTVPGRIEAFRGDKAAPLVVVDYAHTPQALEQILKAVRAHTTGKLWCVFGCGGDRDRGKRPLMGAAAARFADVMVITDDNPRSEKPETIVAEIKAGLPSGCVARVVHDRAEAIASTVRLAGANDAVVVAGKGHEETQTYGAQVRRFSDREFVAKLVSG